MTESAVSNHHRSDFQSQGERCAGNLLLPEGVERPPVVILGHGFAAERQFALPEFARVFAENGFAAYYFDYRGFGDSEGEPRHWVSPRRHQQDWRAAIAHVRSLPDINPDKLAIWGSSYGGGHVLQLASENLPITAVIAQVPHVNGISTLLNLPLKNIVKASLAGLRDVIGSLFGRPYYSPVVARPTEFAAMNSAESWDGYMAIVPEGTQWENKVLARAFLTLPLFSPMHRAGKIGVPTLIIIGGDDTVTPPEAARKTAGKIPKAELHCLASNHFQVYAGEVFKENIALQLEFLKRQLA